MATALTTKGNVHDKMNISIIPSTHHLASSQSSPTSSYPEDIYTTPSTPTNSTPPPNHKTITLNISDLKGRNVQLKISPTERLSMLKKKASSSLDGAKLKNCRAVHHSGRPLADNLCLRSQNIQHQDCILLLPKRENPRNGAIPSYPCPNGPNKSTINRATKHLPKAPLTKPSVRVPPDATDFFRDLRRILLTLIDSAYLLQSAEQLCGARGECYDNDETVEEMESGPEDELAVGAQGYEVDSHAVQTLTSMGYSRARAIHALQLNKMEVSQATDWLVRNSSADIPVVGPNPSTKSVPNKHDTLPSKKRTSPTSSVKGVKSRCIDSQALRNLKDMGFKEEDIIHALQLTGNNQQEACEWLLGEKTEPLSTMRLSKNSKLYKDLFSDPVVQLGLTSPHNLQVLEDMLRNPELVSQYFNDPEVGPLLLHISQITIGHGGRIKNT
ncbi:Ubiquitin-associated domain-containing protein 1 [Oopsacas minuta]|uniref:Ubiquitin-associated domain-containing protein 1 n=1 Tax=Oopsacas minuta TaxID=111878 RepID=A0AAV7K3T4_9METZ|nr:Ubiquitin-associated domain-containing protein 1 [Oopsacas minuta]